MQIDSSVAQLAELALDLKKAQAQKNWASMANIAAAMRTHLTYVLDVSEGIAAAAAAAAPASRRSETKPAARKPRGPGHPTDYVRQLIAHLQPGETTIVPFGEYEPRRLAKVTASAVYALWGARASITSMQLSGVEVLRIK